MRVIAGALGGRTLVAPPGMGTRPTADRVREALFSILGELAGAEVLDLYAGTGALGIEALSRGAGHATFVESGSVALKALRRNVSALGIADRSTIVPVRVERSLSRSPWGTRRFDLVFMDPPYAEVRDGAFAKGLAKAVAHGFAALVTPGGRMVLEHASSQKPPLVPPLALEETRTYGDTSLSFYIG